MNFFTITSPFGTEDLTIDKDRYHTLLKSRAVLSSALALEEKFDLLISNYLELEADCLNCALQRVAYDESSYDFFSKSMLTINRRMVNLLTSARLYVDHLPQNIKLCALDQEKITTFKSRCYDENFSFRFMEALRNYVQHCGFGIHLATSGSKALSPKKEGGVEFKFNAFSCKKNLQESGKFKKKVLDEMPEKVNIIAASRSYIDSMRMIHTKVRKSIHDTVISSREEIKKAIDEYSALNNKESEGLKAVKFEKHDTSLIIIEEHSLLLDWDEHRIRLYEKNRSKGDTSNSSICNDGVENWYIRMA